MLRSCQKKTKQSESKPNREKKSHRSWKAPKDALVSTAKIQKIVRAFLVILSGNKFQSIEKKRAVPKREYRKTSR